MTDEQLIEAAALISQLGGKAAGALADSLVLEIWRLRAEREKELQAAWDAAAEVERYTRWEARQVLGYDKFSEWREAQKDKGGL